MLYVWDGESFLSDKKGLVFRGYTDYELLHVFPCGLHGSNVWMSTRLVKKEFKTSDFKPWTDTSKCYVCYDEYQWLIKKIKYGKNYKEVKTNSVFDAVRIPHCGHSVHERCYRTFKCGVCREPCQGTWEVFDGLRTYETKYYEFPIQPPIDADCVIVVIDNTPESNLFCNELLN